LVKQNTICKSRTTTRTQAQLFLCPALSVICAVVGWNTLRIAKCEQ